MGKKIREERIVSMTVDCTPMWVPVVADALRWVKDAKQFEKSYRKDCTDYDGAMEAYTDTIMDCAKGLDIMNKRNRKKGEVA